MNNLFVTVLSFLVTVGVLVVIHELGHYGAARLMGEGGRIVSITCAQINSGSSTLAPRTSSARSRK